MEDREALSESDELHTYVNPDKKKKKKKPKRKLDFGGEGTPAKKRKSKRLQNKEAEEETLETATSGGEFGILFRLISKATQHFNDELVKLKTEISKRNPSEEEANSNENTEASFSPLSGNNNTNEEKKIIYSITNLNSEKPRFSGVSGTKEKHPVTFIEDLTSYLRKIPAQGKELDIVQECLIGQARDWSRVYKGRWTTFEDFKSDFLTTYWGEVDQNKVRRDIVSNKWDKNKHSTMLSHFLSLAGQVNLLQFTIPEGQLVADIMRHYPKQVQQLWSLSRKDTILAATEFLKNLDLINQSEAEHGGPSKVESKTETAKREETRFTAQRPEGNVGFQRRFKTWDRPKKFLGVEKPKIPALTSTAAVVDVEKPKETENDLN